MTENRLAFLKEAFRGYALQFSEDFSSAVILNPNYNENVFVYDEEFEYIVCFSFQHRHMEDEEELVEWINEVINGNKLAIEFFANGQRRFGSEIGVKEIQEMTYKKLEQFTGSYGAIKLLDRADSFKVRGWDSKNNFDYSFICQPDGTVTISKSFVGIQ